MVILRQYIENGMQVTEYTRDYNINEETGEIEIFENATVSHRTESPEQIALPPEDSLPVPETLDEKIARLEQTIEQNNLVNLDIQLSLYEQIMTLQTKLNGGNE